MLFMVNRNSRNYLLIHQGLLIIIYLMEHIYLKQRNQNNNYNFKQMPLILTLYQSNSQNQHLQDNYFRHLLFVYKILSMFEFMLIISCYLKIIHFLIVFLKQGLNIIIYIHQYLYIIYSYLLSMLSFLLLDFRIHHIL